METTFIGLVKNSTIFQLFPKVHTYLCKIAHSFISSLSPANYLANLHIPRAKHEVRSTDVPNSVPTSPARPVPDPNLPSHDGPVRPGDHLQPDQTQRLTLQPGQTVHRENIIEFPPTVPHPGRSLQPK